MHNDMSQHYFISQNRMVHTMLRDVCKSHQSTSKEISTQESLDDSEYPELGQKKTKIKSTPDQFVSHHKSVVAETMITCAKNKEKRCREIFKMAMMAYFKSVKSIRTTEHVYEKIQSGKFKLNICKPSVSGSNRNKSNEMNIPLRKNRLSDAMFKKPSRLKKTIITERRNNMKMKHQDDDNAEKINEIHVNVNSINLNSLKIQSDPRVDINYVKHMSTLNVYGTNYRHSTAENISENIVQYCPDLTQKLNELKISNVQDKKSLLEISYRNSVDDVNNLNVSFNSSLKLSLTDENNVNIKPNINHLYDVKYSKNFREYCNNLVTLSLNESLDKFLSEIRRLQSKLYRRNENKGKYKRRYYSGLKEVQKHVILKKVRFVVIAPDIEKIISAGGLNEEVDKLLEMCRKNETVYCFGLRRRKLGYYAHGNGFVSCIGISNYANAEELFWNVLVEVVKARNAFEKLHGRLKEMVDVSKLTEEDGLLMDNIDAVLKSLTSIN